MRNSPKTENEIDCLVDAEYELDQDSGSSRLTVLIKHDYYSSDNEHGRTLLRSFLSSLISGDFIIDTIILIDSGVRLADKANDLNNDLIKFINTTGAGSVYICTESKEYYGVIPDIDHIDSASSELFGMINWMTIDGDRLVVVE